MTICPHCGLRAKPLISKEEHSLRVKAGLAKSEKRLGRPPKVDPAKIYELRDQGYSLNHIADALHISKGAVQYTLRNRPGSGET